MDQPLGSRGLVWTRCGPAPRWMPSAALPQPRTVSGWPDRAAAGRAGDLHVDGVTVDTQQPGLAGRRHLGRGGRLHDG